MDEKIVNRIGWFGSLMGMAMFASYSDQIRLNVSGHAGSMILPIVTSINCVVWIAYGSLKTKKDWPIISVNTLGAVFSMATIITAIAYN